MKTFILSASWKTLISWLSTHVQEEQKKGGKEKGKKESVAARETERAVGAGLPAVL